MHANVKQLALTGLLNLFGTNSVSANHWNDREVRSLACNIDHAPQSAHRSPQVAALASQLSTCLTPARLCQ